MCNNLFSSKAFIPPCFHSTDLGIQMLVSRSKYVAIITTRVNHKGFSMFPSPYQCKFAASIRIEGESVENHYIIVQNSSLKEVMTLGATLSSSFGGGGTN